MDKNMVTLEADLNKATLPPSLTLVGQSSHSSLC